MGGNLSEPFSKNSLSFLEQESLIEDSEVILNVFHQQITVWSEGIISSYIKKNIGRYSKNISIMIKTGIKLLEKTINGEYKPDNSLAITVSSQTVICLLRYTIFAYYDVRNDSIQELNSIFMDPSYAVTIYSALIGCLHLPHSTVRSIEPHWGSSTRDDSKFDWQRIQVIECLMMMRKLSTTEIMFPSELFLKSVLNMMRYYQQPKLQKRIMNLDRRRHLIQASLLLILYFNHSLTDLRFTIQESLEAFSPLLSDLNRYNGIEDIDTFLIPLGMHFLQFLISDNTVLEHLSITLITNILHIIDRHRSKSTASSALLLMEFILSFPSLCLSLNVPCLSFESDWPVHRGTHSDLIIEVVGRCGLLSNDYTVVTSVIISEILPFSANLCYLSAVTIYKVLALLHEQNEENSTLLLLKSIHYCINRSVRENIPLVIVTMKQSQLLISLNKKYSNVEEIIQMVSFIKNINQELKQIGGKFKAEELEVFFKDPACEHFAIPVLHPPTVSFESQTQIFKCTESLVDKFLEEKYGFKEKKNLLKL